MSDEPQAAITPAPSALDELPDLLSLSRPRTAADYQLMARLSAEQGPSNHQELTEADRWELQALIAEYVSLRQESMNSINNRVQTMVLGLASVAALAGGVLAVPNLRANPALVTGVFSFAIPLVCAYIILTWIGEAIRANRVGYYIASNSEARINNKLGRLVLTWETALWTGLLPRDELWGPSMVTLGIPGAISLLSPGMGLLVNGTGISLAGALLLWEVLIPYVIMLVFVIYCATLLPRLRNNPVIRSALHPVEVSADPATDE